MRKAMMWRFAAPSGAKGGVRPAMKGRRVVITACSAITPIGHTRGEIVESLRRGVSGVKPLREDHLLSKFIHSQVFGTVDYPVEFDFRRTHRKTMGPVAYYACQVPRRSSTRPACRRNS